MAPEEVPAVISPRKCEPALAALQKILETLHTHFVRKGFRGTRLSKRTVLFHKRRNKIIKESKNILTATTRPSHCGPAPMPIGESSASIFLSDEHLWTKR